jgi:predicted membrane channel-forming protein YqfA (hemolysin III family)
VYTIIGSESIVQYSDGLTRDFIILLAGLALVGTIVPTSKSFFENLPKYSLRIFTRFGVIVIPYMRNLDEISLAINNAREIK